MVPPPLSLSFSLNSKPKRNQSSNHPTDRTREKKAIGVNNERYLLLIVVVPFASGNICLDQGGPETKK